MALLFATVSWPLGVGAGLLTGRYAFLGEAWQAAAAIAVLTGMAGIVVGVLAHRAAAVTVREAAARSGRPASRQCPAR